MKAFKIFEVQNMKTLGYVVANDMDEAESVLTNYCDKYDDDTLNDGTELKEITRDEFIALLVADDMQEPDEHGNYPLIEYDYDCHVENETIPYVIEFEH